MLLSFARHFVAVGDLCVGLHNDVMRAGYLLRRLQQAPNNAYFPTPIPAGAASPGARLFYSPHNESGRENRSSKARKVPGPRPPTSKGGVVIDEKSGTTWFSRFLSWAEGKNKQYVQSMEKSAKELKDMETREHKDSLLRRVQEAKQKLRKDLKSGK
jgi:hypothetical protein